MTRTTIWMALAMGALLAVCAAPTRAQDWTPTVRLQGVGAGAKGQYEPGLLSPKAAAFSPDGRLLYVNALEAGQTLVFGVPGFRRVATIDHTFGDAQAALFQGERTVFGYPFPPEVPAPHPNRFMGKPVEMAFSHGGRYLWVPYYRRSTDPRAAGPSAVAIIDTTTHRIVRVMPTGPLPKFVAVSRDNRYAVVVHWGDNSLMRVALTGPDPSSWTADQHWSVGPRMDVRNVRGDRDKVCGFCLRGAVFSADGTTLLVARMGGGGMAGFDVATGRYLGTVSNVPATPRHLVLSRDGRTLWVTSNVSGRLSRFDADALVAALREAAGRTVGGPTPEVLAVGAGARTVEVSPDERHAFVAANSAKTVTVVDLQAWKTVATLPASPFPVGLAVSPDGCWLASTSQGRQGQGGGNAVDVWRRCPAR